MTSLSARAPHLRGVRVRAFTLVEVVVVMVAMGVIAGLFMASLGSADPMTSAAQARTAVSVALDAVAAVDGTGDSPDCAQAPTAANLPVYANPCVLNAVGVDTHIVAADVPVRAGQVSVTSLSVPAGPAVALVAVQESQTGDICHAVVRVVHGGQETYVTYPAGDGACTGTSAAAAYTAAGSSCAAGTGDSWRHACALPAVAGP